MDCRNGFKQVHELLTQLEEECEKEAVMLKYHVQRQQNIMRNAGLGEHAHTEDQDMVSSNWCESKEDTPRRLLSLSSDGFAPNCRDQGSMVQIEEAETPPQRFTSPGITGMAFSASDPRIAGSGVDEVDPKFQSETTPGGRNSTSMHIIRSLTRAVSAPSIDLATVSRGLVRESGISGAGSSVKNPSTYTTPSNRDSSCEEMTKMMSSSTECDNFKLKDDWSKIPKSTRATDDAEQILVSNFVRDMFDVNKDCSNFEIQRYRHMFKKGFLGRVIAQQRASRCQRIVINPASSSRVSWDLAGVCLIAYDMISIPIHLAFSPDPIWFTVGMGWITLSFWTLDIVISFLTGYFRNGILEMDLRKIVVHYLRGWFLVDCIVVLPDWLMKIQQSEGPNAAGLARILRAARVIRVLRLLRMLKLRKLATLIYDFIDSEVTFIVFNLLKMLIMILFMNHVVACGWYGVGIMSKQAGAPKNWLEDVGMTPVWGTTLAWKYFTSLHWSITQFTPASMDVSATNVSERIFSIVILFWALVSLSSVIGSCSAAMTALRNMSADANKQMWILRRYLKQQKISAHLSQRILRYLEFHEMEKRNHVPRGEVHLLQIMPAQFQDELHHEMHSPYLRDHPFFSYMTRDETMQIAMRRVCHQALTSLPSAQEENLFSPGEEGQYMHFVKMGCYEYTRSDGNTLEAPLTPKMWAAEANLWTIWRHRGWLRATQISMSISIHPKVFVEIFFQFPKQWFLAMHYGVQFIHFMNQANPADVTDIMTAADVWACVSQASDRYEKTRRKTIGQAEFEFEETGSFSLPIREPISTEDEEREEREEQMPRKALESL